MPETRNYSAKRFFTGNEWVYDHQVEVVDGIVNRLTPFEGTPEFDTLLPSFIDLQLYGAHGRLFSVYPDAETLAATHDYCSKGGAWWFQPTVATNTNEVFRKAIDGVRRYWEQGGAGCLGLHLEGPWISRAKRGAHIEELVHPPSMEEVESLLDYGRDVIKMITLAPEVCNSNIIQRIQAEGIVVSAGHSNAGFETATSAFDNGVAAVTHLYNAMSGLQHREPGMVGAAMLHGKVMASIIADGHHVDWPAIRIAAGMMKERLFLITDAVTDTQTGAYQHQLEGDKYTAAGILSGSALTMFRAVKNCIEYCGIDSTEAIKMATLYPAKVMGQEQRIGCIRPGAEARFIATDELLSFVKMI